MRATETSSCDVMLPLAPAVRSILILVLLIVCTGCHPLCICACGLFSDIELDALGSTKMYIRLRKCNLWVSAPLWEDLHTELFDWRRFSMAFDFQSRSVHI